MNREVQVKTICLPVKITSCLLAESDDYGTKSQYCIGDDCVFLCITGNLDVFEPSADEQCMLRLESDLILADLAVHASNRKGKFMTIMLKGSSKSDVPCFLNLFMKYHWPKDERKIRCMIEGQPEIVPAPVSNVKTDPPSLVVKPAKLS